jgi:hypothetical protein
VLLNPNNCALMLIDYESQMFCGVQASAAPVTWLRVMLELQRDRARQETTMEVQKVAAEYAGAYGQGMRYVMEMFAAGSMAS